MNAQTKEIRFGKYIFRNSRQWFFMIDTSTGKSRIISSTSFQLMEGLIALGSDIKNIK